MEGLFHAIERGNQLLGEAVAFSPEWANTENVTMAWLECLAAFFARERVRHQGDPREARRRGSHARRRTASRTDDDLTGDPGPGGLKLLGIFAIARVVTTKDIGASFASVPAE